MKFIIFSLITISSWASEFPTELKLVDHKTDKAIKNVTFSKDKRSGISVYCPKESCLATQSIREKKKPIQAVEAKMFNPAGQLCLAYHGTLEEGLDQKGVNYDLCLFSDKSLIDIWSLKEFHEKSKN